MLTSSPFWKRSRPDKTLDAGCLRLDAKCCQPSRINSGVIIQVDCGGGRLAASGVRRRASSSLLVNRNITRQQHLGKSGQVVIQQFAILTDDIKTLGFHIAIDQLGNGINKGVHMG